MPFCRECGYQVSTTMANCPNYCPNCGKKLVIPKAEPVKSHGVSEEQPPATIREKAVEELRKLKTDADSYAGVTLTEPKLETGRSELPENSRLKEHEDTSFTDHTSQNTSGRGALAVIPPEIQGWNWGAFLLGWIWGIGNNTYISFLTLIPFVGVIMAFVLGTRGNEWAWRNKRWKSIEHFKSVQDGWAQVGLFILSLIIITILLLLVF